MMVATSAAASSVTSSSSRDIATAAGSHSSQDAASGSPSPADVKSIGTGILMWYFSSVSITAVNKILFDTLNFNYPLLITAIHFAFMSLLLRIGFSALPCFFPELPQVQPTLFVKFIVPIAFFSAAEIALSNLSYAMVSLSVMMVIKSSLVVVTYLLGVVVGLEVFQWKLLGIIVLIVGSISFTVPGLEVRNHVGVVCLVFAVLTAAMRWVFVHHQLQRMQFKPLQLMILTQPLATIFLAPCVLWDVNKLIDEWSNSRIDIQRLYSVVILVTAAIFLAFLLLYSEYNFVRKTSSVSLTVAGIGKEVITIVLSMVGFKEHISWRAVTGIGLSIVGIMIYTKLRFEQNRAKQTQVACIPLEEGSPSGASTRSVEHRRNKRRAEENAKNEAMDVEGLISLERKQRAAPISSSEFDYC